jgi:hypothetical protein
MKSVKITSRHKTILEAVQASNFDLSYNESLAMRDLNNPRLQQGVRDVFVGEDGEIYYTYKFDILLFHKYSPFSSCITSGDFEIVNIIDDSINFTGVTIPNNRDCRKMIAKMQETAPHLAVS